MTDARQFPVIGHTALRSVPWSMLAPHEAQAERNHGQTLDQLAARGGLCPLEIWAVVHGKTWRAVDQDALPTAADAAAWLAEAAS